ncbi:hypothetical protein [Streptomyces glomeratus]|uniref:Uncharacterized protein n=1 Tax=Streptomyces glomeratus TaxID=284452 RepID=A0ABP6LV42_9ACTN|nr:hypothetical protein [Streptomyces glomeratus]MCF1507605.1 hypothetical protein [Streptomyces glomeratus]
MRDSRALDAPSRRGRRTGREPPATLVRWTAWGFSNALALSAVSTREHDISPSAYRMGKTRAAT